MKSLLENIDLMTYKINFNYEKKSVYHSLFGILISVCIYSFLIVLIRYFAKDFFNKTNPKVIYQENEFTEDFKFPIDFILKDYYYLINFETKENFYNLTSTEVSKNIYNQTNEFFNFSIIIEYFNSSLIHLEMIEKIDISSLYEKKDGKGIFRNYLKKNPSNQKFNLKIYNNIEYINYGNTFKYDYNLTYSKDDIKFENYNITIEPKMNINFRINKNDKKFENVTDCFLWITNMDNIINVNKPLKN